MSHRHAKSTGKSFYNEHYYSLEVRRMEAGDRFTRTKVARVTGLLQPCAGELIVDLGCGAGTMMIRMAGSGARMIGLDYAPYSLELSRSLWRLHAGGAPFRGVCCDGRTMALRDGSADAIMAVDFTEHLDDAFLEAMIADAFRVLAPGGRFVIYTPNAGHLFERMKKRNIIFRRDTSHIGLRTMEEYCAMLEKHGFAVDYAGFEPTHIMPFALLEKMLMNVPGIGPLTRRRICLRAKKRYT
jgi:SAM-dependent methyltransferase